MTIKIYWLSLSTMRVFYGPISFLRQNLGTPSSVYACDKNIQKSVL